VWSPVLPVPSYAAVVLCFGDALQRAQKPAKQVPAKQATLEMSALIFFGSSAIEALLLCRLFSVACSPALASPLCPPLSAVTETENDSAYMAPAKPANHNQNPNFDAKTPDKSAMQTNARRRR